MRKWLPIISQIVLPILAVCSMECVNGDWRVAIVLFIVLAIWATKDIIVIATALVVTGVAITVMRVPYSWIPYSITAIAALVHIYYLVRLKREDDAHRLYQAQQCANDAAGRLGSGVEIHAKIINDRVIFTYLCPECEPELEDKVYTAICRLEHEFNQTIE